MHKRDFGVYFCEVRTDSGLAKAMSLDAHIEELHKDHMHNSQVTHKTPLGREQLRQIEGVCACVCVYVHAGMCSRFLSIPLPYSSSPYIAEQIFRMADERRFG